MSAVSLEFKLLFVFILTCVLIPSSHQQYPWPVLKPMPIEMTSCLNRIPDYLLQSCSIDSARRWDLSYDSTPQYAIKKYCCATWDTIDCVMDLARVECVDYQYLVIENYFYDIGDKVPSCREYPFRSFSCRLPWWMILIIVLVALIFVVVIAVFVVRCFRKKDY